MVLQMIAFTYYLLVVAIMFGLGALYFDLSIYMALPVLIFIAPMIAVYMVYRCCDEA